MKENKEGERVKKQMQADKEEDINREKQRIEQESNEKLLIKKDEQIRKLLLEARQGNKSARDAMIQNNMGLIWSIVRRFANRGYDLEDLFQVGSIGLMKAIDNFDISFDVKFSTYAVPMITG